MKATTKRQRAQPRAGPKLAARLLGLCQRCGGSLRKSRITDTVVFDGTEHKLTRPILVCAARRCGLIAKEGPPFKPTEPSAHWPIVRSPGDPRFWPVIHGHLNEARQMLGLQVSLNQSARAADAVRVLAAVDDALRKGETNALRALGNAAALSGLRGAGPYPRRAALLDWLSAMLQQGFDSGKTSKTEEKMRVRREAGNSALVMLHNFLPLEFAAQTEDAEPRLQERLGERLKSSDDAEAVIIKAAVVLGMRPELAKDLFSYRSQRRKRAPQAES